MASWIFSHLQDVSDAFKTSLVSKDPRLSEAWHTLSSLEGGADALGFTKRQTGTTQGSRTKSTQKLLAEHGQQLGVDEVSTLQAYAAAQQVKRRFWVQALLTFLVVGVCLAMLWRGNASAETQKALFAMLGTVVGYWLR